jgi:hypothetical protein
MDKNAVEGRNTKSVSKKGLFCPGRDNVLIKLYLLNHFWTCKAETRLKIVYTNQKNLNKRFLPYTDKYSSVFTEYSVAEYSAGHYSAEYSADRIVGRSLSCFDNCLLLA